MINVQLKNKSALSISFIKLARSFGPKGNRLCVECDVYEEVDDTLRFVNRGIAICNPVDAFSSRIGAHKSLHSALAPVGLSKEDRQAIHAQIDAWPFSD